MQKAGQECYFPVSTRVSQQLKGKVFKMFDEALLISELVLQTWAKVWACEELSAPSIEQNTQLPVESGPGFYLHLPFKK